MFFLQRKIQFIVAAIMILISSTQAELQVNTYSLLDQKYPGISSNADGRFVIAWRNHSQEYGIGVYARVFESDGRPLTDEFKVNTSTMDTHKWTPAVAMDESGGFVVAWTAVGSDQLKNVVMRLFDPNGQPVTDEIVVNTSDYSAHDVDIALDNNGDMVLVWRTWVGPDDHNGEAFIYARTYCADGTPKAEPFEVDPVPYGNYPQVAIQSSGDFIVTWLRTGDFDYYLKYKRFHANGQAIDANSKQIMGDMGASINPMIAIAPNDQFTIVWDYHPDDWGISDIYAQRFDAQGQAISDPFIVNSYTEGRQSTCTIAPKSDGGFVVCWSGQGTDAKWGVYTRTFNAQGFPTTDDINIAHITTGDYGFPVVTIGANQEPVIAWHEQTHDGSGFGIFVDIPMDTPNLTMNVPQQYASVQEAVNMAIHGDTILLEPGIYRGNLNMQGKDITISSIEPININTVSTTILDGTSRGSVITMVGPETASCTISGLTIRSGRASYGGGINANYTSPVISNCIIQDNIALKLGGGVYACNGKLENCIIRYNNAPGGAGLAACDGVVLSSNIVQNVAIETGSGLVDCGGLIANSIIWDNEPNQVINCQNINYCCVQDCNEGLGNISQDPCFAFTEDFHLMPQSPCIDAGYQDFVESQIDLDGLSRTLDGDNDSFAAVDIGALEFNRTAPCIAVSTRHVNFLSTIAQPDPNQYTVFIRNSGQGEMSWHVQETCPWLEVISQNGNTNEDITELVLDVNAADLELGRYICELEIVSDDAINSPVIIEVRLDVVIAKDELHVPVEYPDIQSAIDEAKNGQRVILDDGIYSGTGNINIDMSGEAITVCSKNGPASTVIDCQYQGMGFYFHNNETNESRIEGLTIRNAGSSGAIYCYTGSPTIENCIIEDSKGTYTIYLYSKSNAVIKDCIIRRNVTNYGGGIYIWSSNPVITGCTIIDNMANIQGGGIRVYMNSHATIQNCVIADNVSLEYGGGIFISYNNASADISNCTIANNIAGIEGGGIYCSDSGSFDLSNSIVWANTLDQIYISKYSKPVTVSYSNIQDGFSNGDQVLNIDPLFADPANGDYHLQSSAGRWFSDSSSWITDITTSPCIDAGNPLSPVGDELAPNGNRINLGAYGGTNHASISP